MFKKLLIANRGEISRRINTVAKSMGISTVAVYSDADRELPFVREADESVRLGPAPAKESYLNVAALLAAAKQTRAQAVHPGYGFVSESAEFARACTDAGITFVGPPPEAMTRMKDKSQARRLVMAAGVPVVPGSGDVVPDVESAVREAEQIGYPVLCKAAGGGGGIGMAAAKDPAELEKVFRQCTDRAKAAFGREGVYLERYFPTPRHIEVQILGDTHGQMIHCLERECSIQRRHQKVVEEAPSPLFTNGQNAAVQAKLFDAAIRAAKAFGYANAGTVEFLYSDGDIFFIEMNARLQVEHPVTELTTGIDLIGWQLRIANGEKLTVKQEDVVRKGAALEFRIYAEDPVKFFPSPGPLKIYTPPSGEGVRLDSGYEQGSTVTPNYDPMIAKLIVNGATRTEAIERSVRALESFRIEGIKTNIPLHLRILASEAFRTGQLNTRFLENHAKA
ncbi:MAG: acetyl-CoA carboxylase biotin carboxylase subunit [Myxococcaceae bacterium]